MILYNKLMMSFILVFCATSCFASLFSISIYEEDKKAKYEINKKHYSAQELKLFMTEVYKGSGKGLTIFIDFSNYNKAHDIVELLYSLKEIGFVHAVLIPEKSKDNFLTQIPVNLGKIKREKVITETPVIPEAHKGM